MTEKHKFAPRWDEHEKGYYCTVCGVLKEEHGMFDDSNEITEAVTDANRNVRDLLIALGWDPRTIKVEMEKFLGKLDAKESTK